jgi:predicted amidohydrolase
MASWSRVRAEDLPETPPPGAVRLAAVQMEPRITENERNLDTAAGAMEEAAAAGATFVVFPECALTGYCFETPEEARRLALDRDGPELARTAEICARLGLHAVVGYLERTGDGIANAASVVGPAGVAGHYRKTHLPHLGVDRWVEAGCAPLRPVEAGGLKTGVLICYDASFPEATRTLALHGAELVVLPTNWPHEAVAKADWLPNARAYENVIYFAAVNRVGTERGYVFDGRSRICGPTGDTLVQGPNDEPALLLADVFPERARTKKIRRRGEEYWVDRIGHRRTDLYEV